MLKYKMILMLLQKEFHPIVASNAETATTECIVLGNLVT